MFVGLSVSLCWSSLYLSFNPLGFGALNGGRLKNELGVYRPVGKTDGYT